MRVHILLPDRATLRCQNIQITTRSLSPVGRFQYLEQPRARIARWNGLAIHLYYTEGYQILFLKDGSESFAREEKKLSDQSLPDGVGDGGGSAWHIQFDEDIAEVTIDGARTDDEGFGYFAIGVALGYQAQYV